MKKRPLNPKSEIGERARLGRSGTRPRVPTSGRTLVSVDNGFFGSHEVFREGAENCARGGRAPQATSVSGLKRPADRSLPSPQRHRFRFRWCLVTDRWLLGCCLLAFACGCRRDMFSQPKSNPLQPSAFFANGAASRPLPPHTVAQGDRQNDELFYTGMIGTNLSAVLPFPLTPEMLERGRQRFEISCVPCHGETGEGNGMVVQRGFPAPPSYHLDRLRSAPIGHFFDVMTRGYGVMFSQAERVTPEDRWAIAAYIRALQLSEHAQVADLAGGELARLTNAP